jgi:hypothetical protein
VHLQIFLTSGKVPIPQFCVVIFVSHLAKKIDAMKLVEDFKANPVAFNPGFQVSRSEVSLRHANYFQLFIGNDLVPNYQELVSRFPCLELHSLSYDIACHALSTSGPNPTYGDPSPIVALNLTLWYSTAFAAGADRKLSVY